MAFKMKGSPAKLGTIEGTSVYKAVVSGDSPLKQPWPIKVLQKLKKLKDAKKATKVINVAKVKNIKPKVKKEPYIPKKVPYYGTSFWDKVGTKNITDITAQKGKLWDKAYSKKPWKWRSDMFREMEGFGKKGTKGYRRVVDVKVSPYLPSQKLYRSTNLGGKTFKSGKCTKGYWIPLEGFGRTQAGKKGWAIKGKGWDEGYGSKIFKDMSDIIKGIHKK